MTTINKKIKLRSLKSKNRFLTLLEMLLVMALLVAAVSIVSINVARAVHEQRFRSEVDLLVNQMRLAQDLMMIFGSNVYLNIVPVTEDQHEYYLQFETPLPKQWEKEITRKHSNLNYIKDINFKDELIFLGKDDDNELRLKFLSNGTVMSKGMMGLYSSANTTSSNTFHRFICLSGYPAKIQTYATYEEAKEQYDKEIVSNQTLTQKTFEELRGKELNAI